MALRLNLSPAKPMRQVAMQARVYTGTVRRLAGVALYPRHDVRMATHDLGSYHRSELTKLDETDDNEVRLRTDGKNRRTSLMILGRKSAKA